MRLKCKKSLLFPVVLIVGISPLWLSCGDNKNPTYGPKVTDIVHTPIKRQTIGNCWIYATTTWVESQLKSYTKRDTYVSESYWTWWHWYQQLTDRTFHGKEIDTGGNIYTAANIILEHGWVQLKDFVPSDATSESSQQQAWALDYINRQIKTGGTLDSAEKRTPQRVRAELDKAFGSNMAVAERSAQSAQNTIVGKDAETGATISLADEFTPGNKYQWQDTYFAADNRLESRALLRRVFHALNDYKPVMMSIHIDFNAQDRSDNGSFKKSLLDATGKPGKQGGHLVVLKDYIVKLSDSGAITPRGDLPPEQKRNAMLNGELVALVAKNSWGTNRWDRGMKDGYTTFYMDYLYGPIREVKEDGTNGEMIAPLSDFLLPPGY